VRLIVSREIVTGRGRERGSGWRSGWRESVIDCQRKGGDRGRDIYIYINILMGNRKFVCDNVGGKER
jgi:hypothetical protein